MAIVRDLQVAFRLEPALSYIFLDIQSRRENNVIALSFTGNEYLCSRVVGFVENKLDLGVELVFELGNDLRIEVL
jgi:hypothetical protein